MFEFIQVLCCGWTLPQGLFVFFKKTVLHVWVYTSPVLWVDVPAMAFCFLQKHIFLFFCVFKSCVTGGRSRRSFLFSSKTHSYIFECIQVLCYGWTLPQGLLVLFTNTFLYFWVYTSPVLRVDAPAGAFFSWKTSSYICFFLCEKTFFYCSFICFFFLLFFLFMFLFLFLFSFGIYE